MKADRILKWKKKGVYLVILLAVIVVCWKGSKSTEDHSALRDVFAPLVVKSGKETDVGEDAKKAFSWSSNGPKETQKTAYLTFDDGPSDNTDKILDILREKEVKATFFVVGKTGEQAEQRYRRMLEEGHSLGLHSYSHDYGEIYASMDNYKKDLRKLRDYLEQITGERAWLYRFPGGSSNQVARISIRECMEFLQEEGLTYMDWNASSEDAVNLSASCTTLNANILKDALRYQDTVILMHDLHECCGTVEGLSVLIDRLREEGYALLPVTRETKPIQHIKPEQPQKK